MSGAFAVSGKRRILLVDDIELNRVLTEAVLRSATYEVCSVSDGAAAIAALEGDSYDLVLMDLDMPGLTGHDTAAEIRRREAAAAKTDSVKLAAISSQSGSAARLRSVEVGMTTHISRPIAPHELLRQIESVFCQPAAAPIPDTRPDPWQKQHYEDWASRLGTQRVDNFLLALSGHFGTLLTLLAEPHSRQEAHRLAHDVASTGGMLGFLDVTRCCRAYLEAIEPDLEDQARMELVRALECAATRLDDHLASVDQASVAA